MVLSVEFRNRYTTELRRAQVMTGIALLGANRTQKQATQNGGRDEFGLHGDLVSGSIQLDGNFIYRSVDLERPSGIISRQEAPGIHSDSCQVPTQY
jgi:hypothetical protein